MASAVLLLPRQHHRRSVASAVLLLPRQHRRHSVASVVLLLPRQHRSQSGASFNVEDVVRTKESVAVIISAAHGAVPAAGHTDFEQQAAAAAGW